MTTALVSATREQHRGQGGLELSTVSRPARPTASLTLTSEDEAAISPLPGHMVKAQKRGVYPQVLPTLPHFICVTRADLGYQRHWVEVKVRKDFSFLGQLGAQELELVVQLEKN